MDNSVVQQAKPLFLGFYFASFMTKQNGTPLAL
jgi:hypothetical protein